MSSIAISGGFDAAVVLNSGAEKAYSQIACDFSVQVVRALSEKYGFDADEAIRFLGLEKISVRSAPKGKKAKVQKVVVAPRDIPKLILPWTGKEMGGDFCHGLRLNHGLHTQCTMAKSDGGVYCRTCLKQADKNASGKPTYGDIESRLAVGVLEFRDPKDNKHTVPFANVMEKLGVTREEVVTEASRFGLEIPEEHFVKRESKRGRPATKPTADSDGSDTTAPKKRGRPKKEKKVIESSVGDDLIASLVAQAQAKSDSDDESTEVAVNVKVTKPKVTKPKVTKPKVDDAEKAAKKAEATEKRKQSAIAKKAEKATTKKAAELAAMKAKMLAMQKDMELATAKILKSEKCGSLELEAEKCGSLELEAEVSVEVEQQEYQTVIETMNASGGEGEDDDEDDEEEEVKVEKFEHGGKNYLRSSDNMLYDPATQECVGCWNNVTDTIEEIAEFDSDGDDDE